MINQPTPWNETGFGSLHDHNGVQVVVWGLGLAHANRSSTSEANADFIRRAVNSHNELLAELKKVRETIEESHHWWMDCPDRGGFDLEAIEEAIEKAEKP